jgi:glycosyltransferase involved in cell wall biosynthesis
MIRVAHVIASFDVGGLQKGVLNLVNRSDPTSFRHLIVSFSDGVAMADRLERGEVETLGMNHGQRRSLVEPLRAVLRRFKADILHTRNWPTLIDGVRSRRRALVPSHVHGYHGRDLTGAAGFGFRRRFIGRILTRRTDVVVALTQAMGAEYSAAFGLPKGGLRIVPNGVAPVEGEARARDPSAPFVVVAAGRLDPVKDYPSLIRAFARMDGRGPDDRLVLVGDGPEKNRLAEVAREAGVPSQVEMPGMVRPVEPVYARADAFVQSSFYEGMSNTLVEAMAAGIPVVATRVGGNADVVGDAGLLYPSGADDALAAHLSFLRSRPDQALALGQRARERVRREFTFERMVRGYEDVYRDLAARRN